MSTYAVMQNDCTSRQIYAKLTRKNWVFKWTRNSHRHRKKCLDNLELREKNEYCACKRSRYFRQICPIYLECLYGNNVQDRTVYLLKIQKNRKREAVMPPTPSSFLYFILRAFGNLYNERVDKHFPITIF